jgi:tetratricopeptide (TPR) repeat protein
MRPSSTAAETAAELLDAGARRLSVGDHAGALDAFQRGRKRFPDEWRFPCNEATVLHRSGDVAGALRLAALALRLAPDEPFLHHKLGAWLLEIDRGDAAVPLYERAARLAGGDVHGLLLLAVAYMETKQVERAGETVATALLAAPDHAEVLALHGLVLTSLGRREESAAALERALELDPACAQAAYHLARRGTDVDPAPLEARLASKHLDPAARGKLCFALGNVYQNRGEHETAFRYFVRANALAGRPWDPDANTGFVDALIATCTRELLAPAAARGIGSAPIFVVGLPRTGSTLLEQMLAAHPRVRTVGEHSLGIPRIARELASVRAGVRPYPLGLADLTPPDRAHLAARYLASLPVEPDAAARIATGELRLVDKVLANHAALGLIALLFPDAKVLHCRRDPRDSGLSSFCIEFQRQELPWTYDLEHVARYYRDHQRLERHWAGHLPLDVLTVPYEELVAAPERWARRVTEFVGLEWSPACLRYDEAERPVFTASALQVREKPHTRAVERWRPYAAHLGPLMGVAAEWGYPAP